MMLRVKSASRLFGVEQVRLLTPSTTTREGRSYADPAEKSEPMSHLRQGGRVAGVPIARWVGSRGPVARLVVSRGEDGKAGQVPGDDRKVGRVAG